MTAAGAAVRGYVLAGGRSSRMGSDKAALRLGGMTLQERALVTMREVCGEVAVVGSARELPEGVRSVPDRLPGNGPMGGMEAALRDAREHGGRWAVFLPVDMPLVPPGLLRGLVSLWVGDARTRIGFARTDGVAQPLLSVIDVAVLPFLEGALERGDRKLRPVLESAGAALAEASGGEAAAVTRVSELRMEDGRVGIAGGAMMDWRPTAEEWRRRVAWFLNANYPSDLDRLRDVMDDPAADLAEAGRMGWKH